MVDTPVWTMANSSPPSRATNPVVADATVQAGGDRFQQFVADRMAERVVDALEFVDVDVDAPRAADPGEPGQLLLQLFVEQRAVRQIGQRVIMGEMRDLLLGAPTLGDVLLRRDPAAVASGSFTICIERPSVVSMMVTFLPADVAQRRTIY